MLDRFKIPNVFDYFLDVQRTSNLSEREKNKEQEALTSDGRRVIYEGSVQKLPRPNSTRPSERKNK